MKFLIAGDGPSAISFALKLQKSRERHQIYTWPLTYPSNDLVPLSGVDKNSSPSQVATACERTGIQLVVLASEDIIASGLGNVLQTARIPCFGPSRVQAHFGNDRGFARRIATDARIKMTEERGCHQFSFHLLAGKKKFVPLGFTHTSERNSKTFATATPSFQIDAFMRGIVNPFLTALLKEGITYNGWLSFCGKIAESGETELTDVSCLPPTSECELVCEVDQRDWAELLTFLSRQESAQMRAAKLLA